MKTVKIECKSIETSVPSSILVSIMYRDADNYKNSNTYRLTNKNGLTQAQIESIFEEIGEDEVLSMQWGLPSLAPISHPEENAGPSDHCYNEIKDIKHEMNGEKSYDFADEWDVDISAIDEALKNGGTEEWFAFEKSIIKEKIESAKSTLIDNGHTVLNKHEKADLDERALPIGIDKDLLLKVASIGLTNNKLIEFLVNEGVAEEKEIYALQTQIARVIA